MMDDEKVRAAIMHVQKVLCELLTPLASDDRCLGLVVTCSWDVGDAVVAAGVRLPGEDKEAHRHLLEYTRKLVDGRMTEIGEHWTERVKPS